MHLISLKTAAQLTGLCKRTLQRRIAAGHLLKRQRDEPQARTEIALETILHQIPVPLTPDDLLLVQQADQGGADAQCELGLLFLDAGQDAAASHWLAQAAERGHADAMTFLGACHLRGAGVARDEALALMWISRAAALGHAIARRQMTAVTRGG